MKGISRMHTQSLWHWWPFRLFLSYSKKTWRRRIMPAAICRSIREPSHCLSPSWISVWSLANSLNKEVLRAAMTRDNPAVPWECCLQSTGFHVKTLVFIAYLIFNDGELSISPAQKQFLELLLSLCRLAFTLISPLFKICHGSSSVKPALFFRESSVRTV